MTKNAIGYCDEANRKDDYYLARHLKATVACGYHKSVRQFRTLTVEDAGWLMGFRPWYSQVKGAGNAISHFGEAMDVTTLALIFEQMACVSSFIDLGHELSDQGLMPALEWGGGGNKQTQW